MQYLCGYVCIYNISHLILFVLITMALVDISSRVLIGMEQKTPVVMLPSQALYSS